MDQRTLAIGGVYKTQARHDMLFIGVVWVEGEKRLLFLKVSNLYRTQTNSVNHFWHSPTNQLDYFLYETFKVLKSGTRIGRLSGVDRRYRRGLVFKVDDAMGIYREGKIGQLHMSETHELKKMTSKVALPTDVIKLIRGRAYALLKINIDDAWFDGASMKSRKIMFNAYRPYCIMKGKDEPEIELPIEFTPEYQTLINFV